MENLIGIFLNSVFVGNILLAYFLGMCSFVAISKNMETSIGLGFAVVFVLSITTPMNWLIYHYLLSPGALAWAGLPGADLSYLKFITFIAVIAAMVQAVEMVIDRFSPALYNALGVFLPLITASWSRWFSESAPAPAGCWRLSPWRRFESNSDMQMFPRGCRDSVLP
jgi:Na+-transporting NADH:ubiquinone oxidoreductase subunit E